MHAPAKSDTRAAAPSRYLIGDAGVADLEVINGILEAAVSGWGLSARVLRLTLPSLRYDPADLPTMHARVLSDRGTPVGFSCTEPAERRSLMLHGLYVLPRRQRRGIGARLLADALALARAAGYAHLATRAWRESHAFFLAQGFVPTEPGEPLLWPRPLRRALD
jgi:GNAT superfamily N-acetyltransferase